MRRFPGTLNPRTFLLAAALFAAVASPLAAQQATAEATGATPASAPAAALAGPRLPAEYQRVEPSFSESHESRLLHKSNHTITVSTLVLVLAVVILVLLIT
jgi:hypothetical protein